MKQILATKRAMTQMWTKSGKRIPVTELRVEKNTLLKTNDKTSLIGYGERREKTMKSSITGLLKKLKITGGAKRLKELTGTLEGKNVGDQILATDIFKIGDIVDVTGISKGSGFTGVMKRHGFKGGKRTHGQSDRARAPGSIGAGTTPGRVYKNKRMAGRAGSATITVENLRVVKMDEDGHRFFVKGLVPGAMNGMVTVTKVSEDPKFEGMI